jgi:hypothetical protein
MSLARFVADILVGVGLNSPGRGPSVLNVWEGQKTKIQVRAVKILDRCRWSIPPLLHPMLRPTRLPFLA